jgi:hypothetical protein
MQVCDLVETESVVTEESGIFILVIDIRGEAGRREALIVHDMSRRGPDTRTEPGRWPR